MSSQPARILLVDDTPANLRLLSDALEPHGYEILTAANGAQALKIAARAVPDLILLDVMMPGVDGHEVCRTLKDNPATQTIPVIFVTARQDPAGIVSGFRAGAVDYLLKPVQPEEVATRVAMHLQLTRLHRELQVETERRREVEAAHAVVDERLQTFTAREAQRWGLAGFVGESPHLRRILEDIERLHQFGKTTVLITGESGTGKELVARAIHHRSPRAGGAFIPVNCVAIPGELAESHFFGHVKGAFTGAVSDRKGYFQLADGGTLFLDEIGDMPLGLQAKLLRVLEDGEVTPLGATKSQQVDVRVLSATNADLLAKVAGSSFRHDLYFRLARYVVETPPLRDRPEDIPLIARHFLGLFASEMGRPAPALTPAALRILAGYGFPGNVRELKNVLERALILSGGAEIEPRHLQLLAGSASPRRETATSVPAPSLEDLPYNLEAAELALIQRALEATNGNVVEAARLLGVNRSRIYRRFPQIATAPEVA